MLDADAVPFAVLVDEAEPVPDPIKEFDVLPVAFETFPGQADAVRAGFVEHEFHVGEDVGGVLALGDAVALGPELLGGLADGLDEPEFLHVAGGEGAVEIVDEGDDGFASHNHSIQYSARSVLYSAKIREFRE